jgi:hypothetical protein
MYYTYELYNTCLIHMHFVAPERVLFLDALGRRRVRVACGGRGGEAARGSCSAYSIHRCTRGSR